MPHPVLKVSHLSKKIGHQTIVKDVSFEVEEGQIFGFLGPNGAGKTTTIRMLVGLIRPTAGRILINGYDLQTQFLQAMQHVGCIVENPDLYPYLSGYENLSQLARMQGPVAVHRVNDVAEMVRLHQRIHERVANYSLGMRQRLGIAQAMLNNPKLLILDEPTNGLDPAGIRELRTFLQELAHGGMSIFISSHLLAEVELLCNHVAMIRSGTVIKTGSIEQLLTAASDSIDWEVTPLETAHNVLGNWAQGGTVEIVERDGKSLLRCSLTDATVTQATQAVLDAGCDIHEIRRYKPTLEDVFLATTGSESTL